MRKKVSPQGSHGTRGEHTARLIAGDQAAVLQGSQTPPGLGVGVLAELVAAVDGREGEGADVEGVARVVLQRHLVGALLLAQRQHLPRLRRDLRSSSGRAARPSADTPGAQQGEDLTYAAAFP